MKKQLNVGIDLSLFEELRAYAQMVERSFSNVAQIAIKEYLKNHPPTEDQIRHWEKGGK